MQVMAMQAETTLDSEEVIVVEENLCTAAMAFGLMRAAAGTVKSYQELVNAVNNGGNIKLGDNIEVTNTINVATNVTLDLAGKTLSYASGFKGNMFYINGGQLTLTGEGTLQGRDNNDGSVIFVGGKDSNGSQSSNIGANSKLILESNVNITGNKKTTQESEAYQKKEVQGGAIYVKYGTFKMKNGTISNNTAGEGGGIFIGQGGSYLQDDDPLFTMTGGTVSGNTATAGEGGGIYIRSNKDNEISGGSIINNITKTTNDLGGGGIYVENSSKLTIINAVITNNTAKGLGGGVAGCLHGDISNISPETAAIYNNKVDHDNGVTAELPNTPEKYLVDHGINLINWDDNIKNHAKDYFCAGNSVIGSRSLNGGTAVWEGYVKSDNINSSKKVSSKETNPIKVTDSLLSLEVMNPDVVEKAADTFIGSKVIIEGNTSYMHGGGVASNGILAFGQVRDIYPQSNITLKATKTVNNNIAGIAESKDGYTFILKKGNTVIGTAKSDSSGIITFSNLDIFGGVTPDQNNKVTANLILKENGGSKAGMDYDPTEYQITIVATRTLDSSSSNNTETVNVYKDNITGVTLKIGDNTISNGATYTGNEITINGKNGDNNEATFTNTMNYGNLKITKNVIGKTLDSSDPKSFNFTITLSAKINGTYTTDKEGKNVTFTNGTSDVITLADKESITIKNLPANVTYTVTEKKYDNYTTTVNDVTATSTTGTIDKDTPANVVFTNSRDMSNLSVTKTVELNKDTSEDPGKDIFKIFVTLGDSNEPIVDVEVSDANTSIPFEKEGTYTFNLKHGQTAEITGIPVGAKYTVKEESLGEGWDTKGEIKDAKSITKDNESVTITNHYFKQKTTNITVKKQWNNAESAKMPDSITVQLQCYENGFKVDSISDTQTLNESNNWSYTWKGLDVSAGEKSPLYTYTVKEISVNYPEVESGYTTDERDGNIIRVRSGIETKDGTAKEIVGGWFIDDNVPTVNAKDENSENIEDQLVSTITNTWRPAAELGKTSFTVYKVDSEKNEDSTSNAINGVEFTLTKNGTLIDTKTTGTVEGKDGYAVFEKLTSGTYTLTETKAPADYNIKYDGTNGNVGRTWIITIDKDELLSVEEVNKTISSSDDETYLEVGTGNVLNEGTNIVGENTWSWKPNVEGIKNGVLEITNNVVKGNISIKKELNLLDLEGKPQGIEDNALASDLKDMEFTFNLYEGNAEVSENGAIDAEPLKTFNIKAGETAEFKDLRYGTYTIAEADPANGTNYKWADVDYSGRTEEGYETGTVGDTNIKNAMVVNVAENGVTLAFTAVNTYNLVPGSLVIEKHVTGIDLEKFKALNDFDKLVFNVTDSNGSEAGQIFIPKSNFTVSENGEIVGYSDSDNPLNLIPGEYTITEDQNSAKINGYALKADPVKVTVKSGLVTEGDVNTASFNNEYTVNSLSIVKKVEGSNAEKFSGNTFYVDIINAETNDVVRSNVAVAGNGTAAVESELPAGNYKVVERDASQRGYRWTVTYSSDVVTIVDGGSAEVTVTNTYRRIPSDDPTPDPTPNNPQTPTTPEEPTPVVDVPDPDTPLAELPEPDVPLANIPEDDTPLSELPEDDVPLANIPDEETPLVELPEDIPLANIPDEDVPLINIIDEDVPKTGDMSLTILWIMLCLLALSGITVSSVPYLRKRRK